MSAETELDGVVMLGQTHPASHGIDDVLVTVHSGVGSLDPVAVLRAVITARVFLVGLLERHGFGAAVALVTFASGAVTESIWEALSSVVHEGVRGKDGLDLPVAISSGEEQLFEVSVLVDIALFDEDGPLVLHISGR